MILLDTNVLIRMLVEGTAAAHLLTEWISGGQDLCTASVCWYEFLSGPVDDEGTALVTAAIADRVLPFTADQAREASRIWNAVGRLRRTRIDAVVAAAAIVSGAELATSNAEDFRLFAGEGLRLLEV